MSFPDAVAEELLVSSGRRCGLCRKFKGVHIELHHIVPKEQGGQDTFDNGIPLCFDCHAEVKHYDPAHPRGRKLGPSELRKHRDRLFAWIALPPWHGRPADVPVPSSSAAPPADVVSAIRALQLWHPDVSWEFLPKLLRLNDAQRAGLIAELEGLLRDEDEDVRWHAAIVVEFFVQWNPELVNGSLLKRMSSDESFSVRSSAAVSYYCLAGSSPDAVPVEVLGRLASHDEDWYVVTPAVRALVRLARTRRVAVEVLADGLLSADLEAHRHAAEGLRLLLKDSPPSLLDTVRDRLLASADRTAQEVGALWRGELERRQASGEGLNFYMF